MIANSDIEPIRKLWWLVLGVGIAFTCYLFLLGSSDSELVDDIIYLVWQLSPYFILTAIYFLNTKSKYGIFFATIAVIIGSIFAYIRVFHFPQSSTDGLIIMMLPMLNIVFAIPLGYGIGYIVDLRKAQ